MRRTDSAWLSFGPSAKSMGAARKAAQVPAIHRGVGIERIARVCRFIGNPNHAKSAPFDLLSVSSHTPMHLLIDLLLTLGACGGILLFAL